MARFILPESRPDQNEKLHGVQFTNGVAEVLDEHAPALSRLLVGYYGCTLEGAEKPAETPPPPADVKSRLAAMAYPELQALAKTAEIKAAQKREDLEAEIAAAIEAGKITLPAAG